MDPIERAARAYCAVRFGKDVWDVVEEPGRSEIIRSVRAVLEAIRDVDAGSPAMLVAGKEALYSCCEDPELQDARKIWYAMIDTALNTAPAQS